LLVVDFGLQIPGLCSASNSDNYTIEGNELQDAHNLQWVNFGYRHYDVQLSRWNVTDPAEQYYSPYIYCGNNPINGTDPDGAACVTTWVIEIVKQLKLQRASELLNSRMLADSQSTIPQYIYTADGDMIPLEMASCVLDEDCVEAPPFRFWKKMCGRFQFFTVNADNTNYASTKAEMMGEYEDTKKRYRQRHKEKNVILCLSNKNSLGKGFGKLNDER